MLFLIILFLTEILTFLVIRKHYKGVSQSRYYLASVINVILSAFLWIIFIEVETFRGDFDDPVNVWLRMTLAGAVAAIVVPRIILVILHYAGLLLSPLMRKGEHSRALTNTGIIIYIVALMLVSAGTLSGRFRFTTGEAEVMYDSRGSDREIVIVHISDLHLATYSRHPHKLEKVVSIINGFNPDIIINSGDFVSYGWREFGRFDTILSREKARYGKYAVLGNHDMGTYHPGLDSAGRQMNVGQIAQLIESSGYVLLNNDSRIVRIDSLEIGIGGVPTSGRRMKIVYGDPERALRGLDSADFRILVSHDPNHWKKEITGKTTADLTLSGHTHGFQIGLSIGSFKISPSALFYHEWNGLYQEGSQYLYVNRGLGVLGIPFRIGMPPEITVIRLVPAER